LNQAIIAYENKNYKETSSAFQELQSNSPDLIALRFYTGLSELGEGNSDIATNIFKEILDTPDHLFVEQSRWYLALAYLQKGDRNAANLELTKIKKGQFKHDEAKIVLNATK
jgi:predicted Zn-dependent protease